MPTDSKRGKAQSLANKTVSTTVSTKRKKLPTKKNDLAFLRAKSLILLVGVAGFELATPCTPCKFYSYQQNVESSKNHKKP